MLSITDFQTIIAGSFFDGSMTIAGLAIFAVVLLIVFKLTKNLLHSLMVSVPVLLIFSAYGIITGDALMILIIVIVLGLALSVTKIVDSRR